jgi:hypothetical protein
MDGGMRSATHADLAKGYDVVVVFSIGSPVLGTNAAEAACTFEA